MSTEPSHSQHFVVEAREHLASMASGLITLERGEGDVRVHFEQLLRSAHSLKGWAGFTGRLKIAQLAHAMEAALERIRDGGHVPTPEVIDTLLFTLDRLGAMIDDADHAEETDIRDLLAQLRPLAEPLAEPLAAQGGDRMLLADEAPRRAAQATLPVKSAAQPAEFPLSERVLAAWQEHAAFLYGVKLDWFQCEREIALSPLEVAKRLEQAGAVLDSRMDPPGLRLDEGLPPPPLWYRAIVSSSLSPEHFRQQLGIPCAGVVRLECVDSGPRPPMVAEPPRQAAPASSSLRIPVSLIDRMVGLAGELVLVRNQAVHSTDPATVHLRQLVRRLDSVTNELQDAALRMRMQPVGTLFDRFPRLVRDLARQLGKQIDIEISGSEVTLDKTILETLSDPLTHLVRNCCDHGIETPEARVRAGKPPTGTIRLAARQQRGRILIEIRDDGRGLDREAIKRKALQRGITTQGELDRLSDGQIYDLILLSGFSTAASVTDVSGRGVGMDVVKTNLEQIGGVLEIDSAEDRGTTFVLSLPLTLAIVPCLLLQSGGQRYAIPQRDVEELVLLEPGTERARIECSHEQEVLRLRGSLLPVARLEEVLSRRQPFTAETWSQMVTARHPARPEPERMYVAVLRVGSQRFGLAVDDLLGSEEVVVMPLHALLRPLAVYGATTILGDGGVALILSGEGIARHCAIAHRAPVEEQPALPAARADEDMHALLLFRHGPAELLALSLSAVRRVVMIQRERIERVGERELVNVDGTAVNVMRLDRFLDLSACPDQDPLFLILPRHGGESVGLLASQIVDTPTLPVRLDTQAYRADGILGSMMIRDQIAVFLDLERLLSFWRQATGLARPALPSGPARRILVVEDTHFFRQLIKGHLESAGHEVVLATNGREGLAQLAEGSFDLVVSDIEMPVMDGLAFARQVREDARYASLPLMALTTLSGEEDRSRALACGFDAYEIKLDRQEFLSRVGELLQRGRPAAILPGSTGS